MSYLTEKEQVTQHQHFAFKMRNLFLNDRNLFNQLQEFVPYAVHINKQDNLDIIYASDALLFKGPEMEKLVEIGSSYLEKISCPVLMEQSISKAEALKRKNDADAICAYLQQLQFNRKMSYFYSTKLLLDDKLYFNISNSVGEMGLIGDVFKAFFDPLPKSHLFWQQFQSLTKQEKRVMKLFARGKPSKEVSDVLFISKHTVDTHKKNIKKKLDINGTSDFYKFAIVLDLDIF